MGHFPDNWAGDGKVYSDVSCLTFEADFQCDLERFLPLSGHLFFTSKTKGFEMITKAFPDPTFQNL